MELDPKTLKSMADYQLHKMIQKGRYVDECRSEWYNRWLLNYPYYRSATGIKKYE